MAGVPVTLADIFCLLSEGRHVSFKPGPTTPACAYYLPLQVEKDGRESRQSLHVCGGDGPQRVTTVDNLFPHSTRPLPGSMGSSQGAWLAQWQQYKYVPMANAARLAVCPGLTITSRN